MNHLLLAQPGYESFLAGEISAHSMETGQSGPGWCKVSGDPARFSDLCFAHMGLIDATEITGDTINAIAGSIASFFLVSMRGERIDNPWPYLFLCAPIKQLSHRVKAIEKAATVLLQKRISRVIRLSRPECPPGFGMRRGLIAYFPDFGRWYMARDFYHGGQRRMKDDPRAPSRSFLKVEEAYGIVGRHPAENECVADLGAAPGGWSFSAAQRGARVIAVDNGPLKAGAHNHPAIEHCRDDAFSFGPCSGNRFDWLFCDMVEDPYRVLLLLEKWVDKQWCRHCIVNLKFGRTDPLRVLDSVRNSRILTRRCGSVVVRHLYHDRDEITVAGSVG